MAFGLDDAVAAGLKVLDKFIPDPAAKAKAEAELRSSLLEWDKAQTDINAVEAANPNVLVSGWRPFIGWTCAIALGFNYLTPYAAWLTSMLFNTNITQPPRLDGSLMELVMALLGMAGLRSWEKYKGISK
jgi:hypothetical protein